MRLTIAACVAAPVAILLWLSAEGEVAITPSVLDFGDVDVDNPTTQTVLVTNPKSHPLHVRIVSECDCVHLQPPTLSVPARSEASVVVGLRRTSGDRRDGVSTLLKSEIRLTAGTGDDEIDFVVPVNARFYEPYMVNRDACVVRSPAEQFEQWVIPLSGATEEIERPQLAQLPPFIASVDVHWDDQFNAGELRLAIEPTVSPGKYETSLALRPASKVGGQHPPMSVPVEAHIFPPYQFSHGGLMLGGLMSVKSETVALQPLSTAICTIQSIDCGSEHIRLEQIDERSFSVQLEPASVIGPQDNMTQWVNVEVKCKVGDRAFQHADSLPIYISADDLIE